MGSTHPQPRGRLQNRALCVQQISSLRILLGAWVLSHPRALAGVLQPWTVEASLPAHSFLVTEVRWVVGRKVTPSYEKERTLSCSETSESKRDPLSITEIRFWNGYFFLLRIPPAHPPPVQYTGTKQFDVCFGTLGIMYFWKYLNDRKWYTNWSLSAKFNKMEIWIFHI